MTIVSAIQKAAEKNEIDENQWFHDDHSFNLFEIEKLNKICAEKLKNLKLAMIMPVKTIENSDEKQKLIEEYHNDKVRVGHCGQNKVYKKLS